MSDDEQHLPRHGRATSPTTSRGVWGGVLGHTTGTLYLNHEGYADRARHPGDQRRVPGDPDAGPACRTRAPVGATRCPGRVFATFVDAQTGLTLHRAAQHRLRQRERQPDVPVRLHRRAGDGHHAADRLDHRARRTARRSPGPPPISAIGIGQRRRDQGRVPRSTARSSATDTTAPVLDDAGTPARPRSGTHTLTAKAYDRPGTATVGHAGVGDRHRHDAPDASRITRPTNGSTVTRSTSVTIAATATDNRSVARVLFYVNNTLKCTDTTSAYSCAWAVPSARGVKYTIRVRALRRLQQLRREVGDRHVVA